MADKCDPRQANMGDSVTTTRFYGFDTTPSSSSAPLPSWLCEARAALLKSTEWNQVQTTMQQMVRAKLARDSISVLGDLTQEERESYVRQIGREALHTEEYNAFALALRHTTEQCLRKAATRRTIAACEQNKDHPWAIMEKAAPSDEYKGDDQLEPDDTHAGLVVQSIPIPSTAEQDHVAFGVVQSGVKTRVAFNVQAEVPRDVLVENNALEEVADTLSTLISTSPVLFSTKGPELAPLIGGHLPPRLRSAVWCLLAQKKTYSTETTQQQQQQQQQEPPPPSPQHLRTGTGKPSLSANAFDVLRPTTASLRPPTSGGAGNAQMEMLLADMNLSILQQFRHLVVDSPSRVMMADSSALVGGSMDTETLTLAKTLLSVHFADLKAASVVDSLGVNSRTAFTVARVPSSISAIHGVGTGAVGAIDANQYDPTSPRAVASYYAVCPLLSVFGGVSLEHPRHASTTSPANIATAVQVLRAARTMNDAFSARFSPASTMALADKHSALTISRIMGHSSRASRDSNLCASVLSLLEQVDATYASQIRSVCRSSKDAAAYLNAWTGHCLDTGFVGRVSYDAAMYIWDSLLLTEFESFVPMAVVYCMLLRKKLPGVLARVSPGSVAFVTRTALVPYDVSNRLDPDRIRAGVVHRGGADADAASRGAGVAESTSAEDLEQQLFGSGQNTAGGTEAGAGDEKREAWRTPAGGNASGSERADSAQDKGTSGDTITALLLEPQAALEIAKQPHLPKLSVSAAAFQHAVKEYRVLDLARIRVTMLPQFLQI